MTTTMTTTTTTAATTTKTTTTSGGSWEALLENFGREGRNFIRYEFTVGGYRRPGQTEREKVCCSPQLLLWLWFIVVVVVVIVVVLVVVASCIASQFSSGLVTMPLASAVCIYGFGLPCDFWLGSFERECFTVLICQPAAACRGDRDESFLMFLNAPMVGILQWHVFFYRSGVVVIDLFRLTAPF